MKIQWLGHSAFKVVAGDAQVLFDPFLTGSPVFKGDVAETIKGMTHVLLTHGHNDHFGDTIDILKQTGATFVWLWRAGSVSDRRRHPPVAHAPDSPDYR